MPQECLQVHQRSADGVASHQHYLQQATSSRLHRQGSRFPRKECLAKSTPPTFHSKRKCTNNRVVEHKLSHFQHPKCTYRSLVQPEEAKLANNGDRRFGRSEEHTSELKSLLPISYAVFCL